MEDGRKGDPRRDRSPRREDRNTPGGVPLGRSVERERGAIRPEPPPENRPDHEVIR